MSSIAGFFHPNLTFPKENENCNKTIQAMSDAMIKRGPDTRNIHAFPHGRFCHGALSPERLHSGIPCKIQPFTGRYRENVYTILYDGMITNLPALKSEMQKESVLTDSLAQEEILLCAFLHYGPDFVKRLSGAFAIAIYDAGKNLLYLFRDQLGLRPLFYTLSSRLLVFASEPKGLFAYPGITPALDDNGLNELLSMGPAHTPGDGIFHNISEVKPGHYICYGSRRLTAVRYHQFTIKEHTDSYSDTLEHTRELLDHSIKVLSDTNAPSASLLSGGLDSSFVSAKLASLSADTPVDTYAFDFAGNSKYFHANSFQPSLDAPYVQKMQETLQSRHCSLTCSNGELFEYLKVSVNAHDMPAMADVDSSLIYFCSRIAPSHSIVFTGECADELFCGYPWYHRREMYESDTFPWTRDISLRSELLKEELAGRLQMKDYIHARYTASCSEIGIDGTNTPPELLHRKTFYLTVRYFMQTLADRMDRAAGCCSINARMPFADLKLAEYLFNVPYDMQAKDGEVKHLLRCCAAGLLPEEIRSRKKSPYPKTYDPGYESFLVAALQKVIANDNSPLLSLVDAKKLQAFCYNPKNLGKPWFGQLMAGPQLLAYYLQINYWITKYGIKIL